MTIRIIQIHSKNRKTIQNHIGNEEDALRILNSDSGSYLKIEDGDFWRVITPEELQAKYKFKHDLNFAGDPWKVYVKRVKSMFVANRAIVIRKDHATDIKAVIPIENAEEYLLNRVGDVLLIQDGLGHKVVTDGEFESTYDVVKISSPWMFVKPREAKSVNANDIKIQPSETYRALPILPETLELLKATKADVVWESLFYDRANWVVFEPNCKDWSIVSEERFDQTYTAIDASKVNSHEWELYTKKAPNRLLDIVDEIIENYPDEAKTAENGYAQAMNGRPKWGVDKNFIPEPETTEEKTESYGKAIRTKHHKTDTLALEITEENYAIAAAFLPQKFTTVNPKEVVGYFVIINDRMISIDDRGISTAVGMNNWACHPDIFHDTFIAVDFAYGDFLHCYRENK
ncbi:hypothetical protein PQB77_gp78 [Arthrobacter phage Correa]|uniref:Uncharacterized protein n=1 Tax=Arthrobacter phage Correa TaxID=2024275 RepID=A0A222Z854_9CAUD|nr:hypothetical protein PQB77_gp78 [Arthrobacter phage Correa]ASR80137.1 hypothetical protein SEA_CORREA_78 [Arthrobacter phage Correa]